MRIPVNGIFLNVEVVRGAPGAGSAMAAGTSNPDGGGQAPASPGQRAPVPLVLLHGFTGSAGTWRPHVDALAAGRGCVIAVDLIGHGRSDAPADPGRYTFAHVVADLVGVLDHLGVQAADVLGYSMGGRVAMHLALAAPGRVRALVLESASPGIEDPAERARRRVQDEELATSLERDGIEAFVARWESQPLFATQAALEPQLRAAVRAERLSQRPRGLANSLRGMGAGVQEPLWAELPRLRHPTLVMAGEADGKYRELARRMGALLPDARVAVVPGAGHAVHLERPEPFRSLVLAFLQEVDATPVGR